MTQNNQKTATIQLTEMQAQFLIKCIDTHHRQTTVDCMAMANYINGHYQEPELETVPTNDQEEAA